GVNNEVSRRKFLSRAIGVIGAVLTAGFGVPAVAYLLGTTRQQGQVQTWVPL
ncbi:MAG: twin-arginine translocation signal domain-containing protein, partial [Gemmatimonadales bacterium]|nr:twin-arginine translocation signal domain-containing protein [Gemmatimonadales bacterium]